MWTRGESRDEGPPVRKEQLNSKFLEKTITHTSSYTALVFSDHSVVRKVSEKVYANAMREIALLQTENQR